jgi:hypothetical protein
MIEIENKLNQNTLNYNEFKDYFYYMLDDITKWYKVEHINYYCTRIIDDIINAIEKELDERLSNNKDILLEDLSKEIDYDSIIENILYDYNTSVNQLVGYKDCMNYLIENDVSLSNSLKLAKKYGYDIDKLDSEKLANILYSENQNKRFIEGKQNIMDIVKIFCKYYINNIYKVSK